MHLLEKEPRNYIHKSFIKTGALELGEDSDSHCEPSSHAPLDVGPTCRHVENAKKAFQRSNSQTTNPYVQPVE